MHIPQQLEESLKQDKIIPFVGAGVSMAVLDQSGVPLFPSWKALLMAAMERLKEEMKPDDAALVGSLVNKNRLLDAAKEAQLALGANWASSKANWTKPVTKPKTPAWNWRG